MTSSEEKMGFAYALLDSLTYIPDDIKEDIDRLIAQKGVSQVGDFFGIIDSLCDRYSNDFLDEEKGIYKTRKTDKAKCKVTEIRKNLDDITGSGTVQYDDDLVVIYDENGKVAYKGLNDYSPFKRENWKYNPDKKRYELGDAFDLENLKYRLEDYLFPSYYVKRCYSSSDGTFDVEIAVNDDDEEFDKEFIEDAMDDSGLIILSSEMGYFNDSCRMNAKPIKESTGKYIMIKVG